jgi:hypothetical protein
MKKYGMLIMEKEQWSETLKLADCGCLAALLPLASPSTMLVQPGQHSPATANNAAPSKKLILVHSLRAKRFRDNARCHAKVCTKKAKKCVQTGTHLNTTLFFLPTLASFEILKRMKGMLCLRVVLRQTVMLQL